MPYAPVMLPGVAAFVALKVTEDPVPPALMTRPGAWVMLLLVVKVIFDGDPMRPMSWFWLILPLVALFMMEMVLMLGLVLKMESAMLSVVAFCVMKLMAPFVD